MRTAGRLISIPRGAGYNEDAYINGDDTVNVVDLSAMKSAFFGAPGPGGVANP